MTETKTQTTTEAKKTTQASKPVATTSPKSSDKNTGMAIVAYFLFFVPLLTDAKDDPFVKFHVKQSIVLLILVVISWFIWIIPVIGWLLGVVMPIFILVLWVIGIINAASGKEKPLPLIGQFAEKINI